MVDEVAAAIGTTDMRFYYEREHTYSEVTSDSSTCSLWIRLPGGAEWSAHKVAVTP